VVAVRTLHDEIWLENVEGKSIFVFFDEPQNPDCRALDDVWEKLGAEWQGHPVGLVARVDCGDPRSSILCEEYAFMPLPILMYGDPNSPEFYESEDKSYRTLSAFAKMHISKPPCSIYNMEHCDKKIRQILEDFMAKPTQVLDELEQKAERQIASLEQQLDEKITEVQAQYSKLIKEFNAQIDKVRDDTNYKWLQQVLHDREQKMFEEEGGGGSNEF
jgi:hypothetical protein